MPDAIDKSEVQKLREEIRKLPKGTKEAIAWKELGLKEETRSREKNGKTIEEVIRIPRIPRHVFRDLWLEIRVYGRDEAKRILAKSPDPPKAEATNPQK